MRLSTLATLPTGGNRRNGTGDTGCNNRDSVSQSLRGELDLKAESGGIGLGRDLIGYSKTGRRGRQSLGPDRRSIAKAGRRQLNLAVVQVGTNYNPRD